PSAAAYFTPSLHDALPICSQQLLRWVAYMVGAEVLWRMCRAPVPWEFAKHAIWFVSLVSLLRSGPISTSLLPVLYLGLLIPAALDRKSTRLNSSHVKISYA